MRDVWSETEIVELPVFVPACPNCGGTEYEHKRGGNCGDGSSMQRVVCLDCGERYRINRLAPLPYRGNDEIDVCDIEPVRNETIAATYTLADLADRFTMTTQAARVHLLSKGIKAVRYDERGAWYGTNAFVAMVELAQASNRRDLQ